VNLGEEWKLENGAFAAPVSLNVGWEARNRKLLAEGTGINMKDDTFLVSNCKADSINNIPRNFGFYDVFSVMALFSAHSDLATCAAQ
jgi:hypothetical protein